MSANVSWVVGEELVSENLGKRIGQGETEEVGLEERIPEKKESLANEVTIFWVGEGGIDTTLITWVHQNTPQETNQNLWGTEDSVSSETVFFYHYHFDETKELLPICFGKKKKTNLLERTICTKLSLLI